MLNEVTPGKVDFRSIIHLDECKDYDGMDDLGYKKIKLFNMETMNLQTACPILTELKSSEVSLKCAWQSSQDFLNPLFIYILQGV